MAGQVTDDVYKLNVITPDPKKYHFDAETNATIIPRSTRTGKSLAQATGPRPVTVLSLRDNGVQQIGILDPKNHNNANVKRAFAQADGDAVAAITDLASQVYAEPQVTKAAQMATPQPVYRKVDQDQRQNPLHPHGFVLPPLPSVGRPTLPTPVQPAYNVDSILAELQQKDEAVAYYQDYISQQAQVIDEFQNQLAQVSSAYDQLASTPAAKGVSGALAADLLKELALPAIGEKPVKPAVQVVFDLGDLGQASARYHDIVVTNRFIVLVYDNRYDEGAQYLPPTMQGERTATLTHRASNRSWPVYSKNLSFSWGCFDLILLLLATTTDNSASMTAPSLPVFDEGFPGEQPQGPRGMPQFQLPPGF